MKDNAYEGAGAPRKRSMLHELCPVCGGEDGHLTCLHCASRGVVPTGATAGQLSSLASLDLLRQASGISAAMLRDGRARLMLVACAKLVEFHESDHEDRRQSAAIQLLYNEALDAARAVFDTRQSPSH